MMKWCDYCNRLIDERCTLCKYAEEAHDVDPNDFIVGDEDGLERTETKDGQDHFG